MLVKLNNKKVKVKTKTNKFLRVEMGYNADHYTTYSVTVKSNSDDMGYTSGSGVYKTGTIVTISATPLSGHKFVEWSDGNTEATRSLTVTEDITLTAYFEKDMTKGILTYYPNKEYMNPPQQGKIFIYESLYESL